MMKKLMTLTFVLGAGTLGACQTKTEPEKAAKELREERTELSKTVDDKLHAAGDGLNEVADEAQDVTIADAKFKFMRDETAAAYRAVHNLRAQLPLYITTALTAVNTTDAARTTAMEKVSLLELRIGEAGHAVEELGYATATDYEQKREVAKTFMDRLEDAANTAMTALGTAARSPNASS